MKILNNITLFFIFLNASLLVFPDKIKPYLIFSLFLSIVLRKFKLKTKQKYNHKKLLISIGFFCILIVSCFLSENSYGGFKKLESSASLVVFPLIFYLLAGDSQILNTKSFNVIKKITVFTTLFFLVFSFSYFYITEPFYTFKSTLVHYSNLINIRNTGYLIHPIYLSIYTGVSIIFALDLFLKDKRYVFFALSLILLIFMGILNKKGPILSLVLVGVFYVFRERLYFKKSIYLIPVFLLLLVAIVFLPKYNNVNGFVELKNLIEQKSKTNSSTGIRLQIYDCAIHKITESPIFGYGIGDVNDVLNNCYLNSKTLSVEKNYNTHNQYFSFWLSAGIFGLIAFLFYLVTILKIAKKQNSIIFYLISLFFILNMLTENILEREDGVIFFSFLISLYLFKNDVIDG